VAWGVITIVGAQGPPPAFRTDAELFTLKVQVVASRGKGLPALSAEQFDVRVGGRTRNVLLAELIRQDEGGSAAHAGRGRSGTDAASLTATEAKFFQPPRGQRSALYLLGVEVSDAERRSVKVKVGHKDVTLRGWAWCGVPATCRPAAATPISR
jgi:hypothetical protein